RAGLTGPDGPTHHGMFDLGYLRLFPNMTVMAPGDGVDIPEMLQFALTHDGPVAIRYPKTIADQVDGHAPTEIELGKSEVFSWGRHGTILCCGTQLTAALQAASNLRDSGLDVGVVNARFVKPLDQEVVLRAARESTFIVTVEEAALMGGFGSAVLECLNDAGVSASVERIGVPDEFIEHGDRNELLSLLGLDVTGIVNTCLRMAKRCGIDTSTMPRCAS
ncbi:MAG: 1-deoxy-D-xylulose-5-phosphate synthase, partial [Planctomycetales bacterium]